LKNELPIVYLARHGETAWTLSGQHTGLTDLPLTEHGERTARRLGERLQGLTFGKVFTSPLQRARQTCELAGFGPVAEIDPDLVEWDYGTYEGRRVPKSAWSARTGTCSAMAARRRNASASQRPCGPRR
jgi:broad specificity phosphatase PhoE